MDQKTIHNIISELAILRGNKETREEYLQTLRGKIRYTLETLPSPDELEEKLNQTDKVTIQFITTSLYVLKQLASISKDDSLSNLISIQQQQKIKILLHLIFCIGVKPSLFQGVNVLLANKTAVLNLNSLEDLSVVEFYNMMSDVVRSLFEILKTPNLRSLILVHLGDIMSALIQIIHIGEIKKPVKPGEPTKPGNGKSETFVMTEEWYNKLIKDRIEFRKLYNDLVDDIYKPLVIKELLILMAPAPSAELNKEITPPAWLRRAVSQQLSGYLISPGGVSLIMRATCDSSKDVVDWMNVEAIAKLISSVHGRLSSDEFYSLISPQIISLLNTTGPYCIPVARVSIKNIYHRNPEICNKYIFDKLFEPFIICSQPVKENFDGTLISEDSLSRCIDHINKCFIPGSRESTLPFKLLIKIIKIKYKLYMKVAESPYQHKSAIQDLLIRFFHSYNDINKLTAIYNALLFNEPHESMLEMNNELEFEFGPSGGIQVVKRSNTENPSPFGGNIELESEVAGDYMLDLLSHNKDYSKKLLYDLFVVLLSSMSKWYEEDIPAPDAKQDLLNVDELIVYIFGKSEKKMISIKLLAVLVENVQVMESIQENPELILSFVAKLLTKKAESILKAKDEDGEENGDEENDRSLEDLVVTLATLDIMTMNMKVGGDRWNQCKPLLNSITTIKDKCKDTFVKFLANLLYERILTHGSVSGPKKFPARSLKNDWLANLSVSESRARSEENSKLKLLNSNKSKRNKELIVDLSKECGENDLESAIGDACSEDVPTRGHGLIQLAKLIRRMDTDTIAKKEYVFTVLKQNLRHEDTYIYLAAINGLEALANIHSGVVLEVLSEEYVDDNKDADMRMKVGEVLVRVTRILGDVIPKYKALLVNTFLIGAKNKDELLRASSLSNLGEVLKILRFGVGDILQEVRMCI
ncbi:UNVERIFIED_CONTAM: hypothetical protein PYX00_006843 [Menopon gallinae]|uniref:RNA polymerase II assembly factor Rtp1 C-terminal domain-containing protein n=1 Tax=Menopon gallinae TaxID=328185 RepID=A0AAW2HX04_9NEOP